MASLTLVIPETPRAAVEATKWRLCYSRSAYDSSLLDEYDEYQREVKIWLFCRNVGSLDSYTKNSRAARIRHKESPHWLLVFEFEDDSVRAIEGVIEDNLIHPSYSKFIEDHYVRVKYLETRKMSPKDVRILAVENKYNGASCILSSVNGQTWINGALEKLRLQSIPDNLNSDIDIA